MIVVNARCHVLPDRVDGFIDEVRRIIPLVRGEDGCIRYELVSDVYHPGVFLFIEEWESRDHLDRHLACPHMIDYFAKCATWFSAPTDLTIYQVHSSETVNRQVR